MPNKNPFFLIAALVLPLAGSTGLAQDVQTQNQAKDAKKWFTMSEVDELPKALSQASPEFPFEMLVAGLEGQVLVLFKLDEFGVVTEATAVESNNPWYERPAVEAVMKWKYSPALKDGKPVPFWATVPVVFTVEGGGDPWTIKKAKNHDQLPPEFRWDQPPKAVATAFPVYPFELLARGVKGKTTVSIIIGPDGRVAHTRVVEATHADFGLAVSAMFETWRFEPARRDGQPCYAGMTMEHSFDPKHGKAAPIPAEARLILDELDKKNPAVVSAASLDAKPKVRFRRAPVFPGALQGKSAAGEATIEFFIDRNGDVQLPRVVSATQPEFGWAAAQAVATWRFEIPRKDGEPVTTKLRVPVSFKSGEAGKN